jgi:hypothetical protein
MTEFDNGVLFAVAKMMETHADLVAAADVLKASDLANADVSGLDPYDQQFLLPVNNESGIKLTGFVPRNQMVG